LEKRRYQRLPREVAVDITYIDPATREEKEVERSCSRNISALGLLVLSDQNIEIGSLVRVEFDLPDSPEHVTVQANVVRVEEITAGKLYDIGLEFVDIDDLTLAKINAVVLQDSSS
jgi:c-di-GMP-binding flagellar brake protein YcgR